MIGTERPQLMQWFEIQLKVRTALGTLLSADTLFGHLCWAVRYQQGESALQEFLSACRCQEPPLILSDPFPNGFWPMPHLPRLTPRQEEALLAEIQKKKIADLKKNLPDCPVFEQLHKNEWETLNEIEAFDSLKWMYKLRFLPDKALQGLGSNLSTDAVFNWFLENEHNCGIPNLPEETVVAHNTISRLTGTTGDEGSFFFTKEWHINPSDPPVFRILAASSRYSAEQIQSLLTDALQTGYGKYKSRGKGKLTVESISPFQTPSVQKPNAVLLLASCAPAESDPAEGFWKLHTKIGKLGGDWAVGPHPSGIHDPYKKPLILLTAGSIFKTDSPRPFYGRLVPNIHRSFEEVCQYAIAPALPVCCNFTEDL